MKYNLIDKRDHDIYNELKKYSFEELKKYFEPEKNNSDWAKWKDVEDIWDLEDFLRDQFDGYSNPYIFKEVIE